MPKPSPLTPERRALISRIGGFAKSAKHDATEGTAAARAAGPGRIDYWENQVDPDRSLPAVERRRRAEAAKKAHFTKLALRSAQARSGRSKRPA
jgi:hypothetical protein